MQTTDYFSYLVNEIHSIVAATVDERGEPVTCAIDMMDWDQDGLYFLTAKGKGFYRRLQRQGYLALTGMKGTDTLSCTALSIRGKVRELGPRLIPRLFEKNPYMNAIYPDENTRGALSVFQLYEGTGEWFDLSQLPIQRADFSFGGARERRDGFIVTSACTGCKLCYRVCPQKCIDISAKPVTIDQRRCLRCGNCESICPSGAVIAQR